MTICLQERSGIIHIIGFSTSKGSHYTLCDKFFRKNKTMETFAVDNTFNGVCKTCHLSYEAMYKNDLDLFTQLAHGQLLEDLADVFNGLEKGRVKITDIYDYLEDKKQWEKLSRYQRLVNRK